MRPLSVVIPETIGDELDRLAREAHRRPKDHAALLLIEAVERAGRHGDASLAALAAAFETEGRDWFAQADSPSAGLVRRLILQTRGETWIRAAGRLRAAVPDIGPNAARAALPDDRLTAA